MPLLRDHGAPARSRMDGLTRLNSDYPAVPGRAKGAAWKKYDAVSAAQIVRRTYDGLDGLVSIFNYL